MRRAASFLSATEHHRGLQLDDFADADERREQADDDHDHEAEEQQRPGCGKRDLAILPAGDQDGFGFIARALDYGGLVFEDEKPTTLTNSLDSLEKALTKLFKEQGIECPMRKEAEEE